VENGQKAKLMTVAINKSLLSIDILLLRVLEEEIRRAGGT
jgi:hypothetical protein